MGEGYIDIIRLYVYVSDAKKIWQQIRGYANTHRAQLKSKPPSGSGADAKKPSKSWEYAGDVEFLLHLGVTHLGVTIGIVFNVTLHQLRGSIFVRTSR